MNNYTINFISPAHRTLSDIYPTLKDFLDDYKSNGIPTTITEDSAKTLYYLLQARYGSWQIASDSSDIFSMKLFAIIFQYAPTWEKKLDIQSKVRNLTEDEIRTGTKAIYNQAMNSLERLLFALGIRHFGEKSALIIAKNFPSIDKIKEASLEELTSINTQNTTGYKKSKLDAYMSVWSMLATDVTEELLARFKPLFSKWVLGSPLLYADEEEFTE